ncbi:MAG TPA: GAP family protein [Solirubrobacterales bacterium]|nr:GAP family protein [Solirubrobacterales bacterium]
MGHIFLLSLVSAANATLLAAVTVMLFLPSPKRLLLGYLAGALLTSLTIGFLIVFVVHDSSATNTAENAVSPSLDIAFGLVLLLVAYVLGGGHDQRLKERRKAKKSKGGEEEAEKSPSKVEQLLGRGSARVTFALGVVLTLPGVSYLAALRDLQELGYGTGGEILVIVGYNLMLLILLEIPLLGYILAPERTVVEVQRFRAWLARSGRRMAITGAAALGVFLIARGVIGYVT